MITADVQFRVSANAYAGLDNLSLTIDYTTIVTHWLVNHISYARTFFAPLHIGHTHMTADVVLDHFAFPQVPGDPMLSLAWSATSVISVPTYVRSTTAPSAFGSR
jgi:hypothetical protein